MVIRFCFGCRYHEFRFIGGVGVSHCGLENCWSRFTKCIVREALRRFLEVEKEESCDEGM